jgi:protein-disulfide isomerase
MNRRNLIGAAAIVAIAAFAGGTIWVNKTKSEAELAKVEADAAKAVVNNELIRPHSPILGNPDAPVTLVEFFDPSCEACRAFFPYVEDLLKENEGKLRVVLRYAALHPGSDEAVRILETARLQGKFEPVLAAIIERQPQWAMHEGPDLEIAWKIAGEAGLDIAKAKLDRAQPSIVSVLNADSADVAKVGIEGTPSFFINGKPLIDFSPEGLKSQIEAEIKAVEASR